MTDTQIEKIEKFLSGKMEPGEQEDFHRELEADEDLLAAYNTHRFIDIHMPSKKNHTSEESLKKSLTKLGEEFFNTGSKANTGNPKKEESIVKKYPVSYTSTKRSFLLKNITKWQIAAAIFFAIVLIGAWYALMNKKNTKDQVAIIPIITHDSAGRPKNGVDTLSQTPVSPDLVKQDTGSNIKPNSKAPGKLNNEQLFAKHFKPDAAPKDQEGPLEDAFDQYENKQYANAAAAFENADLNTSTRSEATDTLLTRFYASYYKALSYMAIKKDAKAIPLLKDLSSPNPVLQVKVQWYLALAYLRTGNVLEATSLLRAIAKNSGAGEYRLKAKELIIELRK